MIQALQLQQLRQRVNPVAPPLHPVFAAEIERHDARMRQPTIITLTGPVFYIAHTEPQIHRFCRTHGLPRPMPDKRVWSDHELHGRHGATVLVFDSWELTWRGSRGWRPEFFHGLKLMIVRVSDRDVEKCDLVKFEIL